MWKLCFDMCTSKLKAKTLNKLATRYIITRIECHATCTDVEMILRDLQTRTSIHQQYMHTCITQTASAE